MSKVVEGVYGTCTIEKIEDDADGAVVSIRTGTELNGVWTHYTREQAMEVLVLLGSAVYADQLYAYAIKHGIIPMIEGALQ